MAICVVLLNICAERENVTTFLELVLFVLLSDCVISNVLLIISLKIFVRRFRQAARLEDNDLKVLKREYVMMIAISLIRVVLDLYFVVIPQRAFQA
jgi:hypothetical protein